MDEEVPFGSRPGGVWPRAIAVGIGYFIAAAAMIACTRFDGGVASLWLATGLLVPELATANKARWWASVTTCGIASFVATTSVGLGVSAAFPLVFVNMGEAMLGAALLRLMGHADDYLDSLKGTAAFTLATGILTPALTSVPAALIAQQSTGLAFAPQWIAWYLGHALGTITFAPICALVLSGEAGRWLRAASWRNRVETVMLIAVMTGVSLVVFGRATPPLLFLPILPLIVIAFRLERIGVASAIVALAVVGGVMTVAGRGPINMVPGDMAVHARLFQFYLAVTVLTILPVAAELNARRDIFRRLCESEARYKLITESSTDMIVTLDAEGIVRYVSPSVREVTGYAAEELIGRRPDPDRCGPERAIMAVAVARARANAGRPSIVEYQSTTAGGETRWFEAHTRGTVDHHGHPTGWVSAIRDVSVRKALEFRLAHAATTDPLTGLPNRRQFDTLLERKIDERRVGAGQGCVALFDIDFFKRVNDEYGHAVGDLVLETFAAAALRTVRAGDHVARLGGEEFGLILDGATVEQARAVCERLRHAVARDVTLAPGGALVSVTVSAGLAEILPGRSRLQLMRAADDALYRAKAAGRDRLALAA